MTKTKKFQSHRNPSVHTELVSTVAEGQNDVSEISPAPQLLEFQEVIREMIISTVHLI